MTTIAARVLSTTGVVDGDLGALDAVEEWIRDWWR